MARDTGCSTGVAPRKRQTKSWGSYAGKDISPGRLKQLKATKSGKVKYMSKPKLLDLFCGAGGAAMGYHRAGFEVVGVDIKPQPHYPFEFYQADALEFSLVGYDAYHASPPCQRYSTMTKKWGRQNNHPDLIAVVRDVLSAIGCVYVIENVVGSPLINPLMLCGTMFGLGSGEYKLRRHRLFEISSGILFPPASCCHTGKALPVYGHAGGKSKRDGLTFPGTDTWRGGMGIDWMSGNELAEAIPPAYTEYIGNLLIKEIVANQHSLRLV